MEWGPSPAIVERLKVAGFWGVTQLHKYNVDQKLITALVERWRPETHTFLLPTGECTITLEDVHMLLDLKVDGLPVTGSTNIQWDIVEDALGSIPLDRKDKDGKCLKLSWLESYMTGQPGPATEEFAFRVYLLYIIGKFLMPNNSGGLVHLKWLSLLVKSPEEIGEYSWGSACLATLYRAMCDAAVYSSKDIGGCTILLQAWAWSRMVCIAPVPRTIQQQPPLANM